MLTLIVVVVAIAVVAYFSLPAFGAWVSKTVFLEEEVVKKALDVNKDGKINAADAQAAADQVEKKVKDVEAKITEKVAKKKMSAPKN
jgi:hypothetical protein